MAVTEATKQAYLAHEAKVPQGNRIRVGADAYAELKAAVGKCPADQWVSVIQEVNGGGTINYIMGEANATGDRSTLISANKTEDGTITNVLVARRKAVVTHGKRGRSIEIPPPK